MAENLTQLLSELQGDASPRHIAEQRLLAIERVLEMPDVTDRQGIVNYRVLLYRQPICQLLRTRFVRQPG